MFHMPESRISAFAIHLSISLVMFITLVVFTYFILLPGFLFYSESGFTILALIGGVDVVLGPLITLIIYKKTKPSIKFDLSLIAIIQIAALLYGLYTLTSVRPIAVFYAQGEYVITYESTFSSTIDQTKKEEIPELNRLKPPMIAIRLPEGVSSLRKQAITHQLETGNSFFINQDKFYEYKKARQSLHEFGISPEQAIDDFIISKNSPHSSKDQQQFAFFPFQSSLKSGYVLLNTETGEFIDIIN